MTDKTKIRAQCYDELEGDKRRVMLALLVSDEASIRTVEKCLPSLIRTMHGPFVAFTGVLPTEVILNCPFLSLPENIIVSYTAHILSGGHRLKST